MIATKETVTTTHYVLKLSEDELKHIAACVGSRNELDAEMAGLTVDTFDLYTSLCTLLGNKPPSYE